jgi:1-acyl-sn-glycerol-3-phosphate acyltransferase
MVQRFTYRLIAIAYIAFVFITSFFFFLIALAIWLTTVLLDQRLWLLHRFTCYWASLYIWAMPPWSVTIKGKENIDPSATYVIVSNHQSLVDILVAFTLFTHFKWVSKAELFNIPLIGWNMSLNQYIKLRRGKNSSIKQMYNACERHLKVGSSVYLFPEGTRSESGEMRKFKEGAFVLAKRIQLPILPLVINGSKTALPKNSLNFHGKTRITVTVLPPIKAESFTETPANELTSQVQQLIKEHIVLDPDESA